MKRLVYIAGLSGDKTIGNYVREDIMNMKSIFEAHENEGQVILRTDEFVTKKSILNRFRDNKILPWLFYFSGHSDENQIELSDGNVPTDVFVGLFNDSRILDALQMVYLGSCDSLSIGKKLIDNKVKVVIASNKKVPSHLANIVSKLFFVRFLISENIQQAFDMTFNDYEFDRSNFNVNQEIDFPWELLTSSETNLIKQMRKINLSKEQKHSILMNSAAIRLDFLNYYLSEDKSLNIKSDLIKDETNEIKKNLDSALNIATENEDIKSLIGLWKKSTPIYQLPDQKRFLRTTGEINTLKLPNKFITGTKVQISDMIKVSNKILSH